MVMKLIRSGFADSFNSFKRVIILMLIAFGLITTMSFMPLSDSAFVVVSLIMLAFYGLLIAIGILSIMSYIDLLYKSLYKKESYRTFTVPAKSHEILISKVVLTFAWVIIISLLTTILSSVTALVFINRVGDPQFFELIGSLTAYIASQIDWSVLFVYLVDNIVSIVYYATLVLFIGSIVNSSYFQNRRTMWFIIFFLISLYLTGALTNGLSKPLLDIGFTEPVSDLITKLGNVNGIPVWSDYFYLLVSSDGVISLLLINLLHILFAGFFSFGTVWLWDHKLEVID